MNSRQPRPGGRHSSELGSLEGYFLKKRPYLPRKRGRIGRTAAETSWPRGQALTVQPARTNLVRYAKRDLSAGWRSNIGAIADALGGLSECFSGPQRNPALVLG